MVGARRQQTYRLFHPAGVTGPGTQRPMHDKRNRHGALIHEEAVRVLAVVAEPFAMVGHEHDQRLVVEPTLDEGVEELPQHFIHIAKLCGVSRTRKTLPHGGRQVLRRVQIEQMQKGEKRAGRVFVDPRERCGRHVAAEALQIFGIGVKRTVVVMKPLVHARTCGPAQSLRQKPPCGNPAPGAPRAATAAFAGTTCPLSRTPD